MTPADIIVAARSALGVPFRHQGRTLAGLDCAGLVAYTCDQLGIDYEDREGYARRPSNGLIEAALDAQPFLERVTGHPQPGDVLLMRFTGEPQHLAIYAGPNIIHSYETVGKVCEHILDQRWARRIVRIYRFKGLSHE